MSLSKELEGSGVHATVICPSAVTGVGMWARASDRLHATGSSNRPRWPRTRWPRRWYRADATTAPHPGGIAAGPAGALLSALSPRFDEVTDRVSRIRSVYRERIQTDRDNLL